ncbi:hypothetical protein N7512_006169 [Penicillium capsulatum]|nr:hypothetical protein N7512_006169 [Penicillium capsulatum]
MATVVEDQPESDHGRDFGDEPRSWVVTTDIYTYIGVIVEVLNESIPRSAWLVIGDKSNRSIHSRLILAYTMITMMVLLGSMMTVIFLAASKSLAAAFVPVGVRDASINYVRVSSVQALTSAIEAAVSSSTRAMDNPDVPLIISTTKFIVNIILDLLFISKFHVGSGKPTVITQAIIRLVCDTSSVVFGLLYFWLIVVKQKTAKIDRVSERMKITFESVMLLVRPSVYTFTESAIRNAIYLWLVHRIISLGPDYAAAWGVFNTIRWGLVMIVVQALEASTLTFIGHNWGRFRSSHRTRYPRVSRAEIWVIVGPAMVSCLIAVTFEVALCAALSVHGIESFAYYLSGSRTVAAITQKVWRAIDWTYIFYAANCQLAAILLATSPQWYLYQSLGSNFLWMLPWAIVATTMSWSQESSWKFYAIIFGGALVFDVFAVGSTLLLWMKRLSKGKIRAAPDAAIS